MDAYIVIEVRHERPALAYTFEDYEAAYRHFARIAENKSAFEVWARGWIGRGDDFEELVWEWVAHDLQAQYRCTLEEARYRLAWLDEPNDGQEKIHQHHSVAEALRRFVAGADDAKGVK